VDRDARVAIEDVDDRGRGQEGERSSDAIVWDAVVVAVKADIRLLAAAHLNAVDRGEVVVRHGQQPCRLVLPGLQDGQGVVLGAGPRASDVAAPRERLGVEVVEVVPGAGGPERSPKVPDQALDLSLLIAAPHRNGPRLEAVVCGEVQQHPVELYGVPASRGDDGAEVVVECPPRHSAKEAQGAVIARDGRVTRLALAEAASISLRTAGRVLADMVDDGLLVADGRRGRSGGYVVAGLTAAA
jgi:hypothetical protein